jgi:hypothetical protein
VAKFRVELAVMPDRTQISVELSQLIAQQTALLQKSCLTPAELRQFKSAGDRIRTLFAELAKDKAA